MCVSVSHGRGDRVINYRLVTERRWAEGEGKCCLHMLLVYHNHIFIHLRLSSCHFVCPSSVTPLASPSVFFLSSSLRLHPLFPPLSAFSRSSPLTSSLLSALRLKVSLSRDETVALTHLTWRLFIGFVSIIRLLEKTGSPESKEEGKKMKEKTEIRVEGNKMYRVRGRTGLGIGMWLYQCALTCERVHACVDVLEKQQQQRGIDVAYCGRVCIWQPTIDKANVACYHTHWSQEG